MYGNRTFSGFLGHHNTIKTNSEVTTCTKQNRSIHLNKKLLLTKSYDKIWLENISGLETQFKLNFKLYKFLDYYSFLRGPSYMSYSNTSNILENDTLIEYTNNSITTANINENNFTESQISIVLKWCFYLLLGALYSIFKIIILLALIASFFYISYILVQYCYSKYFN